MFNLHLFASNWHKSRFDYIRWEYDFETEMKVGRAVLYDVEYVTQNQPLPFV